VLAECDSREVDLGCADHFNVGDNVEGKELLQTCQNKYEAESDRGKLD